MQKITTQELKDIQLDILKRFDEVCRNNNLEYSLAYGTMLGAVRHKGFIPWDDDIDVVMKRADYNRLMDLQYEDENYAVKDYRHSASYYYPFAKMIDKRTVLYEQGRIDKNMGVYIDIFPLDYCNFTSSHEYQAYKDKTNKYYINAFFMGTSIKSHFLKRSFKEFVKCIILIVTYPFKKAYLKKSESVNSQFNHGSHIDCFTTIVPQDRLPLNASCYDGIQYTEFENNHFPIYKSYDVILTELFGDYMTPPKKSEQITHHKFEAYKRT